MEALGIFFAIVITLSTIFGLPDGKDNDNAVFHVQEGQSITIGGGVVEFYDKEKDKTFIYDSITGELINITNGVKIEAK